MEQRGGGRPSDSLESERAAGGGPGRGGGVGVASRAAHHDILWLEVAEDYVRRVHMRESERDLSGVDVHPSLRQPLRRCATWV
eukprot:2493088-Prymnesium_polylepis.1